MDAIEFLTHTNNRNLKSQIKIMVQDKLRQIDEELNERRLKLRHIFEYENLKYSEELAKLMQANMEEAERRRHEWLGVHRMERQIEIDKFLQLKKLQRKMENCEETRQKQSKALLLDTKRAQLYQVKEKEFVRQKEKEIEEMWTEVGRRYNQEMMKQDNLERKLIKTIAGIRKESNLRNYECQKQRFRGSSESEREAIAKE